MRSFLMVVWFQTKLYAKNQYFFWLLLTSTVSMFLTLYLVDYSQGQVDEQIWIKAAIVGMWSSATTAAGAISFQKYQQTLDMVLNQQVDERIALAVLVLPATVFGFLAFPLSYLLALILRVEIQFDWLQIITGGSLLFISSTAMSLTIAICFVLSSDAIIYEQLINIPIVLMSGVFGFPEKLSGLVKVTRWIIPISGPVRILTEQLTFEDILAMIVSTSIWIGVAWSIASHILRLSKKTGRLGEL